MDDGASHRARYRRILGFAGRLLAQTWWYELVLTRIGFARVAERTRDDRMRTAAKRFHALAIELGGLMIKVGQFMSSRLDVLPPEVTDELAGLQDEVPPVPFDAIRALAEAELGIPLDRAYAAFDPVPVAAASLGQAHRARLSETEAKDAGFSDVIVKVQRPGIDEIVAVDLAALRRIAGWLDRVGFVARRVDAPALVEEFAETSREEIDYLHEAASAARFAELFADDPRVGVPEVAWERTTRRVLTLADVTAIKIADTDALRAAGIDPAAVAAVFADVMLDQVFTHGFFHADPHPGNLFVTPLPPAVERGSAATESKRPADVSTPRSALRSTTGGPDTPLLSPTGRADAPALAPAVERGEAESKRSADTPFRITFVDFGMMGEVPTGIRSGLRTLLIAVAGRDSGGLVRAAQEIGVLLPSADTAELERALSMLFERFGGMGFNELRDVDPREFVDFAEEFGGTVRSLPVQLPEKLLLLFRAVSLTSGMCSNLDPDFNIWAPVEPYATRLLRDEGGNLVTGLAKQAVSSAGILWNLPQRVDSLITRVDQGVVTFDTSRLERRLDHIDGLVLRAVSAVLFAALLIAGALSLSVVAPLGIVLMVASVVPLAQAVFSRGPRRPRR